jgi:hypothetical protein
MFRTVILGLAAVATIATTTAAAAVIGTTAATHAISRATMTIPVATTTPATQQWPAHYAGRLIRRTASEN